MTTSIHALAVTERIVGHGGAAFDAARERIAALAACADADLLVPTRVTLQPGDVVAVTERDHGGATLREILNARGSLRAGECVWWAAQAAALIARLHKAGIAHGAINADAVIITDDGVVLSRLVDAPMGASGPADVEALGRLLALCVRDDEAARVGAWTEPMCHEDPEARPTAAMVARALPSCANPEKVNVPVVGIARAVRKQAAAQAPVERLPEGRWWRVRVAVRRRAAAAAALGVVVTLTLGGMWAAGSLRKGAEAEPPAPRAWRVATSPVGERPADAAARLTAERFVALETGDGAALVATTAEGSVPRTKAQETAELLAAGRLSVAGSDGGRLEPHDVRVEVERVDHLPPREGDTAEVVVRYTIPAHDVMLDCEASHSGSTTESARLVLAWSDALGWTVVDTAQAPSAT